MLQATAAGQPCILGPALLLRSDTVVGPRQQEYNCLYCCKALQQGKYTGDLLLQGPASEGVHDRAIPCQKSEGNG